MSRSPQQFDMDHALTVETARKVNLFCLTVIVICGLGCMGAAYFAGEQFFPRYLAATVFVASLSFGLLFWLLLHHLTSPHWSTVLRRMLENASLLILPAAALFLPILLFAPKLYPWTAENLDSVVAGKTPYLNLPFFAVRTVIYFAIWIGLFYLYRDRSRLGEEQDLTQSGARRRCYAAPSLIALGLTTTFAAFDWLMSLDPHWHSNIYGVYFWAGSFSGSLSLIVLCALWLHRRPGFQGIITRDHLQDLGKLQLGFVCFWAYIAFSQYLLIWYANIPEETGWYAKRVHGPWGVVSVALMIGHFVIPFFVLLPRASKRSPQIMTAVSGLVLLFCGLDLYWQILPSSNADGSLLHWSDLFIWPGVVAITMGTFSVAIAGHRLVPSASPRFAQAVAFEND